MNILNYENIDTPFVCKPMTGDGNCVFRSLSELVYGNQDNHLLVRNNVVNYIIANWAQYKNYFAYDGNNVVNETTFKRQYSQKMSTPGVFATSIEIMAAADLYKIYIVVFKDNRVNMTLGNRLNPVKYLRFTGDLESGHVDVYEPVISIETCKLNSTRIKYNYVRFLLRQLNSVKDREHEKLIDIENSVKKASNSTNEIIAKDHVYTNAINVLQNIYNAYYPNTPLADMLVDQPDSVDHSNIDSITLSSKTTDDSTNIERSVATIPTLPSSINVDSILTNQIDTAQQLLTVETLNDKSYQRPTSPTSVVPVSFARIYVNVRSNTIEEIIISLNVIKDLSISSFTKTALNKFAESLKYENETILQVDVEDVFRVNFLRDFISKYGNVGRYINLTGAIGKTLNEKIAFLLSSVDSQTIIENQPASVTQALRQLINKLNDILPYDLVLRIYEEDYYFMDNEMVKSILDAYSKIVPIQLVNKNVTIISREPKLQPLLKSTLDLIETPSLESDFSDANLQEYFEDEPFSEHISYIDKDNSRPMIETVKQKLLDRVRSKQQRRKKQRTLPRQFAERSRHDVTNDLKIDANVSPTITVTTRPIIIPEPKSMPAYFAKIIANVSPILENSLLTCPTNGLNSYPKFCNYARSLNTIRAMNLSALNVNKIYFYEMLKPLAYYGDNELYETKVIYFVFEAYLYYTTCAANYYLICQNFANDTNRDRICLFMINYNFLWHYRQFISKLPASALTAFQNVKILNNIYIYTTRVQAEFNKLPLEFPALDDQMSITCPTVVELMMGLD
ncbi:VP80 [Buzura suppressaria nucleopolyhedrovirus]|uniref:VP80 n=1 Tax=Buzura suppressaria nuclear polyhedrosis virus TaxID=74320 RepID=W5VLA4_NPVBS|nr:VP80 [Buzura suppressaria nucleopolyhedrovirus]AHH82669.1 VP80 [Buzura suppressaria nucleopolyhedrovirus]